MLTSFLNRTPPASVPETKTSASASPLFDEDPVNDYEEDIVQMMHAVEALELLFAKDEALAIASKKELQQYVRSAAAEEPEEHMASWWERSRRYSQQIRNLRIQALLKTVP